MPRRPSMRVPGTPAYRTPSLAGLTTAGCRRASDLWPDIGEAVGSPPTAPSCRCRSRAVMIRNVSGDTRLVVPFVNARSAAPGAMLVTMPRPERRDRSVDDGDALGEVLAAQKRYYDLRAPDYAVSEKPPDRAGRNPFPSELVEPIFEDLGPVGDVLEFACGPGPLFTSELARHADSVTAVDASPTMLQLNQTRVAN